MTWTPRNQVAGLYESLRFLRSPFTMTGNAVLTSTRAYWIYVGIPQVTRVWNWITFDVTGLGTSTQTAEVAIAISDAPPVPRVANSLLVLAASGSLESLTVTADAKRNTVAFNQLIQAGTPVWLGIRTAMGGTQPTMRHVGSDKGFGYNNIVAGSAALTTLVGTRVFPTPVGATTTMAAPDLWLTAE